MNFQWNCRNPKNSTRQSKNPYHRHSSFRFNHQIDPEECQTCSTSLPPSPLPHSLAPSLFIFIRPLERDALLSSAGALCAFYTCLHNSLCTFSYGWSFLARDGHGFRPNVFRGPRVLCERASDLSTMMPPFARTRRIYSMARPESSSPRFKWTNRSRELHGLWARSFIGSRRWYNFRNLPFYSEFGNWKVPL